MKSQIRIKIPASEHDWQIYYDLRWRVLRAPWRQVRGSERDDREEGAFHVMAVDASGSLQGVGRLHYIDAQTAQIRFMAGEPCRCRQGIGSMILVELEKQAKRDKRVQIRLNARLEAVNFYQHHGYTVSGEGPTLYNYIVHKRMSKRL